MAENPTFSIPDCKNNNFISYNHIRMLDDYKQINDQHFLHPSNSLPQPQDVRTDTGRSKTHNIWSDMSKESIMLDWKLFVQTVAAITPSQRQK